MRLPWQTAVATSLSVGLIVTLALTVRSARRATVGGPAVDAYLQKLQPAERELVDVRQNLRNLAMGQPVHEDILQIVADACREHSSLEAIGNIPDQYADSHRQFVVWSSMLQEGASLATVRSSIALRRRLSENMDRADRVYRRVEMKICPDEQ